MNTVICPTILFIHENEWENDANKAAFMKNLEETFQYISNNKIKVYWNDILEELLWGSPNLLPWYNSESFRMISRLKECTISHNDSCKYSACTICPTLINNIDKKDIVSPTLSLFHYVIANNLESSFIVDEKNDKEFIFSCECHNKKYSPNVICINKQNLNIALDFIENNWLNFKHNEDVLRKIIDLFIEEYFSDKKILYKLEFTNSFLSDISSDYINKKNIINSIVNRIIRNQKEACNFTSLDDEPIKGTKNIRSFRVTDECRIQYTYSGKGVIKLTKYSGLGEHNKNLSHTRR